MSELELISLDDFCSSHSIDVSFINTLNDHGLIHVTVIDERTFIEATQLPVLEKISRLHYDLEINMAGIETLYYLLQRVTNMQQEMTALKNKLRRYEDD